MVLSSSCGGGGGDGAGGTPPDLPSADDGGAVGATPPALPPAGGGLNAGASGHLVYGSTEFERFLWHDVRTGERTIVPDDASYDPHPSATGELAEADGDGRVVIRGSDGSVTGGFELPNDVFRAALSPDASIVAVFTEDFPNGGFGAVDTVAFLERDGTVVYLRNECRDVLWLTDGRAVLACDDEILVDDDVRGEAPQRVLARFPGELPNWLVLDPSGTRLAFELRDPVSRDGSVVARMNVDGGDLVRMTADSPLRHGERPTWSPDGQWIGFRRSIFRGPFVLEECPVLMAARVDTAVDVALDDVIERGVPTGGVILVRHDREEGDGTGTPDGAACADSPPLWFP